jgi:hypothetical protein
MGFDRKLSTAEVRAAVERAFARQEDREPRLPTRTDNPVIGELASLDILEYELQRDTAAAGLGIRVSALDKLVKGWRAAKEDENTALPHWNVEPSAEPVDGAALLNNLPTGLPPLRRSTEKRRHRPAAMGAARMDHGRGGHLAAYGAGVADKALR